MKNLLNYLKSNKLSFIEIDDSTVEIDGASFSLVKPNEEDLLFNEDFILMTEPSGHDFYCFEFGGTYYYCENPEKPDLNPLKHIGSANSDISTKTFLGVRGCYEILNGSRLYQDWCNKAKFLGVESLGICEKNTLAGTLKFQLSCAKNKIKPVLGATYTICREKDDSRYDIKCYVKDQDGWDNILMLNKEANVINTRFVYEKDLLKHIEGLFMVFDPKSIEYDSLPKIDAYYQLDTSEFKKDERDTWYLNNLKKFVESDLSPVSITDAFYLDKSDAISKEKLNQIGKFSEHKSDNQFFKSKDEYFNELSELFEDKSRLVSIYKKAVKNEKFIAENCNYQIELGKKHLPKYELTEEEKKKYGSTENLFWSLVEDGLKKRSNGDTKTELKRIKKEIDIIKYGNLIDYFLINWEQNKWCQEQDILVGLGRGSSLGFLTSHLLDITKIHPFDYDLIAERFLTKERALGKIADIDCDYEQRRRDEVKSHLQDKYGLTQCCSVGTYTTLQIKGAFKDLAKTEGIEFGTANRISAILTECESVTDIFKEAAKRKELKKFLLENPNIFADLPLVLESRKARSVHASAFMVTPKGKDIFQWMPVRKEIKDGEEVYVSEWEGYDLEDAGFLKQDILGLKQLDKIKDIIDLVKENSGEEIDVYNLPLDDKKVYRFMSNGWNEDVFQFGTSGLMQYCKEMKPENINDLIAAVALYRPGPMDNNFHNEYVLRKQGKREVSYLWGTEEILKDTYGLMIYQEHIMFICQKVGGFDLTMSDEIRRGLGKKKLDLLEEYSGKFIDGAVLKGCPEDEAKEIWDTMVKFAGYGFNKCISGSEKLRRFGMQKNMFEPTIKEMFDIKNNRAYAKSIGKLPLRKKYRSIGYGYGFSKNEKNRLIKNKIKDIRYEGFRDVYKITVESGETISITDNHKIPTSNGEKMLMDVDIGNDLLYVNNGYEKSDTTYRFTDKGEKNNKYHSDKSVYQYKLNSEKGKMGFQKTDTEFSKLRQYERDLKKTECEVCGKSNCRLEIHHIDTDHGNNNFSNLKTLCVSCHKKEHYKLGRTKVGEKGLLSILKKITSIEYVGKEDVYDVEMEVPYHNFVNKSGIVVCNSHASAYAITGYNSQYLKVNHPIEFWTAAINMVSEAKRSTAIPSYISEINKTGQISIMPTDINISETATKTDFKSETIYWALSAIKQVGEIATDQIIKERNENGDYFSFEEFLDRHSYKGSKVNKRTIENLIFSGAFDKVENIKSSKERLSLIEKQRSYSKVKLTDTDIIETNTDKLQFNWWWNLVQKQLSDIAFFDYDLLFNTYFGESRYIDFVEFSDEKSNRIKGCIAGYVTAIDFKENAKGQYARVTIENNYDFMDIMVWSEQFIDFEEQLLECEKSLMFISGQINRYKEKNSLQTNEDSKLLILK